MGRNSYGDGITVNKSTQIVESVATGGAFIIEDVYPLIDGGQFPVKRIVGEPIEVWADIYRDGHEVIAAALVWRREQDRDWQRAAMKHSDMDRRICDLAAWIPAEAAGRSGHQPRRARRRRDAE